MVSGYDHVIGETWYYYVDTAIIMCVNINE